MKLNRAGDYGVRIVLALALRERGAVVPVRELSQEQHIPHAFLNKVVSTLSAVGILRTHRGATGGAALARDAAAISMLDVIEAIEGPTTLNFCLTCAYACQLSPDCVVRGVWAQAQSQLRDLLDGTDFAQLADRSRALSQPFAAAPSRHATPVDGVAVPLTRPPTPQRRTHRC